MKRSTQVSMFVFLLLISSLLAYINFTNYLFIRVTTYIQFAFGIGFILVLINPLVIALRAKKANISINRIDLLLIIVFGFIVVSFLLSPKYNKLTDNLVLLFIALAIFLFIKHSSINSRSWLKKSVLIVILLIGIIETIYGLLQLAGLLPNLFHYKLGGSFGNPGDLANLLVISYTISLGLFFYEKSKNLKLLYGVLTALQLFVIVLSQARTAWIAGLVSSLALVYYFKFRLIRIKSMIIFCRTNLMKVIGICIIFLILGGFGTYKLYSFKSASADGRLFIWKLSTELILEHPVLGNGYNSFVTVIRQKQMDYFKNNPTDIENGLLAAESVFAFNDYLQFAVEYGLVILILLLLGIIRVFTFRNQDIEDSDYQLLKIIRVSILSVLICMLFSYPLQNPTIMLCFFILLGVGSAYNTQHLFELKLNKTTLPVASSLLLILLVMMSYYSIQSIELGLRWKEAASINNSKPNESLIEYDALNSNLTTDRSFVLNYGSILYKSEKYRQCVNHFEEKGFLCITTDQFLMLGECYEKLNNFQKAEENYTDASFLIPHKFVPKYHLFKIYQTMQQPEKAYQEALEIRKMKIKIYSESVKDIKTEVNKYISDHLANYQKIN